LGLVGGCESLILKLFEELKLSVLSDEREREEEEEMSSIFETIIH